MIKKIVQWIKLVVRLEIAGLLAPFMDLYSTHEQWKDTPIRRHTLVTQGKQLYYSVTFTSAVSQICLIYFTARIILYLPTVCLYRYASYCSGPLD